VVVEKAAGILPKIVLPMGLINWIKTMLSSSRSASNSRLLQTLIVGNLLIMLWIVLWFATWRIEDNVRLVLICLIVSGAGVGVAGKLKGD
jgi:hypothetical protein